MTIERFTDEEKRDEALREVKMRKRVYPRFVADGKMSGAEAERKIDLMQEIADQYDARCVDLFKSPSPG